MQVAFLTARSPQNQIGWVLAALKVSKISSLPYEGGSAWRHEVAVCLSPSQGLPSPAVQDLGGS